WPRPAVQAHSTSDRPLQVQADRIRGIGMTDRNQLPALARVPVERLLDLLGELAVEQGGRDLDDLVLPALTHDGSSPSSGSSGACGSRPALRSASRSTYSICALTLRNSSSAHFCAAASTSAPIRSG